MKTFSFWILLMLIVTSCAVVSSGKEKPLVTATAVKGVLATVHPLALKPPVNTPPTPTSELIPTSSLTEPVRVSPSPVPEIFESLEPVAVSSVGFAALRFAAAPNAAPQDTFAAGTDEIFAVWDYQEMQASDRIRRIWFRDGQIWITREENWNWGKYGSSGTVLDNSIYDHEGSGLLPATYNLQLYVNDELQQEATFTILDP